MPGSLPDLCTGDEELLAYFSSSSYDLFGSTVSKGTAKLLEKQNRIFSGLLVNLRTVVPWLSWLQYLSITRYGCAALQHNEFWGQNFCQGLNVTANTTCSFAICTGEEFLMDQGISLSPGACGSIM
ncbi:broad substrate specificity ATP-binding cassette transporter ABCG2-like [Molossus molossus]|uniref:broad substrate specificity ATP-binding cassette transporter ABCG2-like n=1 Tax=Molossus molossus TaxID=27622 RepID=UPI00174607AF|nr:broad substrate specificity ATP-binding cassette transporter ABCG2-like [Molossus molossus]